MGFSTDQGIARATMVFRMGRASRRKKKKVREQELLHLFYNRTGNLLYGCIMLASHKPDVGFQEDKQSSPFVVSETSAYETVIYGSVISTLLSVRRLVAGIEPAAKQLRSGKVVVAHSANAKQADIDMQGARILFEHRRSIANSLILLSVQARNLFDVFPRINRRIALADYHGKKTGDIRLSDIFNHFVHNQNFYIDENDVRDLFSPGSKDDAPISGTFMGYRFSWTEFVDAIRGAMHEIRMNDFTGLLRRRLEGLSLGSSHSYIVSLIQNLESFSVLLGPELTDNRYNFILDIIFNDECNARMRGVSSKTNAREVRVEVKFGRPHFGLHERISDKKFRITTDMRLTFYDESGQVICGDDELKKVTKEVDYRQFLELVSRNLGEDKLLDFIDNRTGARIGSPV